MRLLRNTPAALALALVLVAAPAQAAQGTGPGALKKVDPNATTTAPAPTQTSGSSTAKGNVNSGANAKTPLTKGTVKKLTTQTPTAPAVTSAPTRTATTPHHQARRSASATSRHAAARRSASGGSHTSNRAAGASHATGTSSAGATAPATGAAPGTAAPAKAKRAKPKHTTAASEKPHKQKDTSAVATINRAADQVIEVIPGVVVLALAGLTALVLVLILRSLLMERRRGSALRASYGVTVQALATAIEAKDHTTGGHIERVRELGLLLARRLVPREAKDPQMAFGFLLHDIGKLAIPDAILRAPGRLSEDEWALMRRHPEEGVRILESIPFLDRALDIVRHHHERWDGGGYPDGLAGTEIPLWARIFSVVDALDAMTAERPYRRRQPYSIALEEIRCHAGSQFDPTVVDALEAIDADEIERLLEPAQILDRAFPSDFPELEPLEALLAP